MVGGEILQMHSHQKYFSRIFALPHRYHPKIQLVEVRCPLRIFLYLLLALGLRLKNFVYIVFFPSEFRHSGNYSGKYPRKCKFQTP